MIDVESRLQAGEVVLPPLPVLDPPAPRSVVALVMPMVMLAGTAGFLVIGGGGTTSLLMGGLMAVSLVAMMLAGGGRRTKPAAEVAADRELFLRQLDRVRAAVRAHEDTARTAAHRCHQVPAASVELWPTGNPPPTATSRTVVADLRDLVGPQQISVRVGVGRVPAVVRCTPAPTDREAEPEPFAALALQWFVAAHTVTTGMPLTVDLRVGCPLLLTGAGAVDLARTVVLGWALRLPFPDSRIVLCASADTPGWEWLKWLPHHRIGGAVGVLRSHDLLVIRQWIGGTGGSPSDRPDLVITVGQPAAVRDALSAAGAGAMVVHVQPPDAAAGGGLVLDAAGGRLSRSEGGRLVPWGTADGTGPAEATAVARRIAGLRRAARHGAAARALSAAADLASLLGVARPAEQLPQQYRTPSAPADRLRVPIGVDDLGLPVLLDLKEAAQGGVGPHGLLVGATGSGKSELLRTLVLALAATHGADSLNLVLIDFKGGAGFLAFQELPHVAAVITNLAEQAILVARMRDALAGELNRRQELLRLAGNASSAVDYDRARVRDPALPALPALVIICDEFTELLVQHPELAETFVMLGRLGRSLGVHLLMASQRMEEGRMRGLDAHLSYRIALKTFSAADSRAVLDSDAAFLLPSTPGVGFLRTDARPAHRFAAAYVSGAVVTPAARPGARALPADDREIRLFTAVPAQLETIAAPAVEPVPVAPSDTSGSAGPRTRAARGVDRLREHGPAAHRIWLPPLGPPPTLDELSAMPAVLAGAGRLRVAVGIVDRPYEQRHDVLWADLSGSTGHALVVGGPRSGKSSLVATLLLGLAEHHPAAEMHVYVVDFGGGALARIEGLPQTGAVIRPDEPERVRRLMAQLTVELARRESGPPPAVAPPEIVLVIDGWTSFLAAFEDLEQPVSALCRRGLAYGIHLVLTTARWADVRPALKDLMGLRFELRLGDPADSEVDRRRAAEVPARTPGRGLAPGGLHFLTAVPGTRESPGSMSGAVDDRRARWPGPTAPPVRLLPTRIDIRSLPEPAVGWPVVPVGVGEATLATVGIDVHRDAHLVVWGDTGCGKTTFLRTLAATIADRAAPTGARFLVVDHRRTLVGRMPADHLAGHATSAAATAQLVTEAVRVLTARLPSGEVGAAELHRRDWWTGPDLFVLVDDYDLVAAGGVNPLVPLLPLLPHARDIGLNLVVCRRASGGARALYDPLLQLLRELGSPGLVMSGPADEGVLHGTRRAGPQVPGRGHLVTRTTSELVQLAVSEP